MTRQRGKVFRVPMSLTYQATVEVTAETEQEAARMVESGEWSSEVLELIRAWTRTGPPEEKH